MTQPHLVSTWSNKERAQRDGGERPTSRRSVQQYVIPPPSRSSPPTTPALPPRSSSKSVALLKVVVAIFAVSMGYYYTSAEVMLVKYATPAIYNAATRNRRMAVLDAPIVLEQQQQQQQQQQAKPLSKTADITDKYATVSFSLDDESDDQDIKNIQRHAKNIIYANTSYVHYTGCCGIGHRLARMSNAYHAAQRLHFALKGSWPSCQKTNVFDHLFESDYIAADDYYDSKHDLEVNTNTAATTTNQKMYVQSSQVVKIHNEVPGYATVTRNARTPSTANAIQTSTINTQQQCDTCHPHKIQSDYDFYTNLLGRFRQRQQVWDFRNYHQFANHTVIGMHVRAGNGEGGDFTNKKRNIENSTVFVDRVHQQIVDMVRDWKDPPLLFLATDTPQMADLFRDAFVDKDEGVTHIKMVELPQIRPSEGEGILFGERKKKQHKFVDEGGSVAARALEEAGDSSNEKYSTDHESDEEAQRQTCLLGWDQAFMDMMILASSDVVVATRRSSFVQTMPLSIVTGKPKDQRKVAAPYCEVSQDASFQMTCHESYMDWCCCSSCVAGEDQERLEQDKPPKRNAEYIKQMQPNMWDMPLLELYKKKIKSSRAGGFFF